MNPTVILARRQVDKLNRDATSTNKAGVSGIPQSSDNAIFAGINASALADTSRHLVPLNTSVDSIGLEVGTENHDAGTVTHEPGAPDLSGLVSRSHKRPVFTGPYSKVYEGMYGHHKVAIKILCVVKSDSVTDRKFRRERFIWWHLRHPNILPLYGYFEDDDGSHALVSEWAEGGSAAAYIHQDLSWDQRVNLLYDVARGLRYLHGINPSVVHGDLKPLNVLINKYGIAQLCDFGLTCLMENWLGSDLTTTTAHTGTTPYLAYELVEYDDKPIPTTATDMYAMGCLGLEFIYRIPPHASLNKGRIPRAIGNGVPPAKRPDNPEEVVPILWDIIEACWNHSPEGRPTSKQLCNYLEINLGALCNLDNTNLIYCSVRGTVDHH